MADTLLLESPILITLINGYNPFTPDAGIFCGGYQGPLYPNPTSLILTGVQTAFDPNDFRDPAPSNYTMKSEPDYYEGLGSGNPSSNYGNPGHILGIIDTYSRMSYGLNIIAKARTGYESDLFEPILPVILPFVATSDFTEQTIGSTNLYPAYSEIPSDYIKGIVTEDSIITLNPRTEEPYIFEGTKHIPLTAAIDFPFLFENVLLDSYRKTIPYLRNLFIDMANAIIDFDTFVELTIDGDNGPWAIQGNLLADMPQPLPDTPESVWYTAEEASSTLNNDPGETEYGVWSYSSFPFFYFQKCTTLTQPQAIKLLTGSELYHENSANYNYKSLTELNGVINLLPIQTHGFTHKTAPRWSPPAPTLAGFQVSGPEIVCPTVTNYLICDICFTTYVPGSITMAVNASIENFVRRWFYYAPFYDDESFFAQSERQFLFTTSVTNNFTWDRKWFGRGVTAQEDNIVASESVFTVGERIGYPGQQPFTTFIDLSEFAAETIIEIPEGGGARTVRGRIILQSKTLGGWEPSEGAYGLAGPFDREELNLDLNITIGELILTHSVFVPLQFPRYYEF